MTPSSSPVLTACLCILLSAMTAQAASPLAMSRAPSVFTPHHGVNAAMNVAEKPRTTDVFRRRRGLSPRGVYLVPADIAPETAPSVQRTMQDESVMRFELPTRADVVSSRLFASCVAPKIVQVATVRMSRHLPKVIYGSTGPCRVQVARVNVKRQRETFSR